MVIDYNAEVQRLDSFKPGEGSQFWKPTKGQHRVKALTELEEAEPFHEDGKDDKPQAKIHLSINGKEVTWTMGKGVSPASAYGQLCVLGKELGGLKDKDFMVVVTNDGTKNTYTIVKLQ